MQNVNKEKYMLKEGISFKNRFVIDLVVKTFAEFNLL